MSKHSIIEKNTLLFPDVFILDAKWDEFLQAIYSARVEYPFQSKHNLIFWRGSMTGGVYDFNSALELARMRLIFLSLLYPGTINAKFITLASFALSPSGYSFYLFLKFTGVTDRSQSPASHLKYKYLISVDGNTTAWERVPWILMSNSVLLKQVTPNIQYFYAGLEDKVNYIAIKEDLSDVFEKFNWLNNNQVQAERIAENGTKFALENLTTDKILEDMAIILREYAKAQKFAVDKPTLPLL